MTTTSGTTTPTSATLGPPRPAGALCAVGGLTFAVLGLVGIGQGPETPRVGGVDLWMAVAAVAAVLTGVGIVAAGRVADVGRWTSGRVGLGLALLGTAVFAVAHLIAAVVVGQDESPLFPVGQVLAALGMVVLGVAVLRRGVWGGAGRWTTLVCGLYPFVVLMPAFAIFGAPNFPAIVGFGLVWALLGGALVVARRS